MMIQIERIEIMTTRYIIYHLKSIHSGIKAPGTTSHLKCTQLIYKIKSVDK